MPAISSIIVRLSSGCISMNLTISPCKVILYPFGSSPALPSSSNICCLVLVSLLILYIDCPLCLTILVIFTSSVSIGNSLLLLAKNMLTSASLAGLPSLPPLKMRFADFSALMPLAELFPSTKQIASLKLDFPEPFGPRIIENPLSKGNSIGLAKDLKSFNRIFLIIAILINIKKCASF